MKFTKLKNKLNALKGEIKRNKAVSYSEWLNTEGLDDNAENRQLYGLYALSIDDSNKKADMRLSQIIGRGVFVAVFLVIFLIMCCNSVSAVNLTVTDNNNYYQSAEGNGGMVPYTSIEILEVPFLNYDDSYYIIYATTDLYGQYQNTHVLTIDFNLSTNNFITDYNAFLSSNYPSFGDYLENTYNDFSVPYLPSWLYSNDFTVLLQDVVNEYDYIKSLGYDDGYDDGYDVGFDDGYDDGENTGFQTGYGDGYDVGVVDGYNEGVTDGYDDGYDVGYTNGINDGEIAKKSIFAIFDAPIKVLTSLLDFDIFGINLLSTFKVILTILLLGAIAKFVLSIAL